MSGSLRQTWDYLPAELWEPLANYSVRDAVAPQDLFSDLFAAADEFLSPRPTDTELEEVRNNPEKAHQRFLDLKGTDFSSESAIVEFIEVAHDVIADYEILGFGDLYRRLLRDALRKFNLRYRLDEPFMLRFLLPGSFSNLYAELHRLNASNSHLESLWADFENAFDLYARTQSDTNLKTSIAKTSNYLEGLASITGGRDANLSRLCDGLSDWPHEKIKEVVKNLYGFCSDYPGIRHGGRPSSQRRSLDKRDSVAINVSLMAMAAYLCKGIDYGEVLGAGLGGAVPSRINTSASSEHRSSNGWLKKLLLKCGIPHQ